MIIDCANFCCSKPVLKIKLKNVKREVMLHFSLTEISSQSMHDLTI